MCDMYNILYEQTTFAEKYYREYGQIAHDVDKAFEILDKFRFDMEECLKYAHDVVKTRPHCSTTVLYIPREYRQLSNGIYHYTSLVH